MKLTDLLDQIDRLEEHVTPGPWEAVGRPYNACVSPAGQVRNLARLGDPLDPEAWKNAEFIALARTFTPAACMALRAVLDAHQKTDHQRAYGFPRADKWEHYCTEDNQPWPCPTVQAITDALGADGD